jgi:hypothetical protein
MVAALIRASFLLMVAITAQFVVPQQPLDHLTQHGRQPFAANVIHDAPHLHQHFHRLFIISRSPPTPRQLLPNVTSHPQLAVHRHYPPLIP